MRASLAAASFAAIFAWIGPGAAHATEITHTVVAGDTLWSVAARYHVSLASLEARNHLDDSSILALGKVLVIEDGSPDRAIAVPRVTRRAPVVRALPTRAAINAMWVATHTGQAPPPPVVESFTFAQRVFAFDERVTRTAMRFLGVPYVWGGTTRSGVDCSGFVQAVFAKNGIDVPRTADVQFEVGTRVAMSELRAGDLVFFQTYAPGASHVGIYLGDGRFIHASSSDGVRVDALAEDYFASRYVGARRLIR